MPARRASSSTVILSGLSTLADVTRVYVPCRTVPSFGGIGAQPPAGGAALGDVVVASVVGAAVVIGVWTVTTRYRRGGVRVLRLGADGGARALGEPRWAALPSVLAAASMLTAVFGFYW